MTNARRTAPSPERLLAFTDATVAIAITLLVLPLVEVFAEPGESGRDDLVARLDVARPVLIGFTISFLVIARLWWAHHKVFESVRRLSGPFVALDLLWLFSIVLLPVPTAIFTDYELSPLVFGLYAAVLALSSLTLTGLALLAHHAARAAGDPPSASRARVIGAGCTAVAVLLALVLGLTVPGLSFGAFLLVALTGPVEGWLQRRLAARYTTA